MKIAFALLLNSLILINATLSAQEKEFVFLEAGAFHTHRSGLYPSFSRFSKGIPGRVAFLGGSITYNGGWRDSVCQYFWSKFPVTDFHFINAGIPSMGSTPGAFRLERDVLSAGQVDLVFVESAVNDRTNGRSSLERDRALEGIIRHLVHHNPNINIVLLYFVDPEKIRDYKNGITPAEIAGYERLAEYYGIPSINLAFEVASRIDAGEFTWEKDFKDLHPSAFGQGIYSRSILAFLETDFHSNQDSATISKKSLPMALDAYAYDKGRLIEVASSKPGKGWYLAHPWKPQDGAATRSDFTEVPMLVGEFPSGVQRFRFAGKAVGIAVAAGPDAGSIQYRIDHGDWKKLDLFTAWSTHIHLPWFYTLAADLKAGRHVLQIKMVEDRSSKSTGNACRIRYFYVNGL